MLSHIRTPRAAVAATTSDDSQQTPRQREVVRSPSQTLWASRPLSARAGRLVAVRLLGEELRVGLATADGLRWVRAQSVLTSAQAQMWVPSSTFAPQPARRRW